MQTLPDKHQADTIIQKALEFAKQDSDGRDPSHDFFHIQRVLKISLFIAEKEKIKDDNLEIIQLAAILHDIADYKYNTNLSAENSQSALSTFFEKECYPKEKADKVITIVNRIGFHKEIEENQPPMFPELAIVADADKLDAMGAFGIARAFSYGAIKNRLIYDESCPPRQLFTKEEYMQKSNGPTYNHFFEKLLKLKSMIKTETGKKMAENRHQAMVLFINHMDSEATLDWSVKQYLK
jgi:uncharacterized protein